MLRRKRIGEREIRDLTARLRFERAQRPEHSAGHGDRQFSPAHFQCDRELEDVAARERPATSAAPSLLEVGNDCRLLTKMDQPVLWNAQRFGSLGEREPIHSGRALTK
jgi:hypothetical protein